MRSTLRRRLMLLGVLLVAGTLTGGIIAVSNIQKTIQGEGDGPISIVQAPDPALPATQRAALQAQHDALTRTLLTIASKNETVKNITAGKNFTVAGIGVDKGEPSQGTSNVKTALLVIKVEGTFYAIVEDVQHNQVTAIQKRVCYGPLCDQ